MVNPKRLANLKRGGSPGRPKGLQQFIRRSTRDGHELATFMLAVFRGDVSRVSRPAGVEMRVTLKDRMDAATWLADRGFGKPTQGMELSGVDGGPIEDDVLVVTVGESRAAAAEFRERIARLAARRGGETPSDLLGSPRTPDVVAEG